MMMIWKKKDRKSEKVGIKQNGGLLGKVERKKNVSKIKVKK